MKAFRSVRPLWLLAFACLALVMSSPLVCGAQGAPTAATAVTVVDNGGSWTLDNGIVQAKITKNSGSMPSLIYHGVEIMAASGGTWEHNPQGAPKVTNTISIDPATNGGASAEISIKGVSGGTFMMTRGAPKDSTTFFALPEVQQMSLSAFTAAEVFT